eukprot:g9721.t1
MSSAAHEADDAHDRHPAAGDQEAEPERRSLPSSDGSSPRVPAKPNSNSAAREQSEALGGDLLLEADENESGRRDSSSSRLSLDSDLDDSWAVDGPVETKKKKKNVFGAVTDWVDDYKTRKSGYGPPYYAEYGGDLPRDCNRIGADLLEVDELLRNGANPNIGHPEDQGLTPIHFAARFGNVELLKMLKRAGGDPNITNVLGLTPLSYSCAFKLSLSSKSEDSWERQQISAITWLLDHGANPNHVDKAGYTPLAWACRSGVYKAVVALVEAGADVMHRRPTLPGGSQVRLPKADPMAVTSARQIERYLQAKINVILQREMAMLRREGQADSRLRRRKEMQDAIARRKEAREFVIEERKRIKRTEELSLELMKVDKAEEARKARRDWLRRMKVSPGIWVKITPEATAEERPPSLTPQGSSGGQVQVRMSPGSPSSRRRKPRPRWIFDTSSAVSKNEAASHDVLEEARQVENFILNGGQKQKIVAPRWRAMTGKRLLRLEHGQRVGMAPRRPRRDGNDGVAGADADADGGGSGGGPPLSGLEEEGSDTSSSDGR